MMASKGWKVVKPHVPMIKFRKGGVNRATAGVTSSQSTQPGTTTSQNIGGATGPNVTVLPTIEDIYLPPRYQRRPIDEKEIAYINRRVCPTRIEKNRRSTSQSGERNKGLDNRKLLTVELVNKLTIRYDLCVTRNGNAIEEVNKAIWATLLRERFTNEEQSGVVQNKFLK